MTNFSLLSNNTGDGIQSKIKIFNKHWKNAVSQVKKNQQKTWYSKLGIESDWYIVIGNKGEGKSSILYASDALVPIETLSSSINCPESESVRFWMMQNSLILDVPGDMIEQRHDIDTILWLNLLKQVKACQNKNTVKGVILCVSTETLRCHDMVALQQKGHNIGERLNELASHLRLHCPVYVLVTKCNKLHDQEKYFENFPVSATKQAMGKLYPISQNKMPIKSIINDTIHYIYDQLNFIRLLKLRCKDTQAGVDSTLFFPEKLKMLNHSLVVLLQPVFAFSEKCDANCAAHLRGVFFTSVAVKNTENSKLENIEGHFLQELFTVVLPGDKHINAVKNPGFMNSSISNYVVFIVWVVLFLIMFIAGVLNYSASVGQVAHLKVELANIKSTKNTLETNIIYLDGIRNTILSTELAEQTKSPIRFDFSQPDDLIRVLKTEYTRRFYATVHKPTQKTIERAIERVKKGYFPTLKIKLDEFLLARIALLTHAIQANEYETPQWLTQPDYSLLFKHNNDVDAQKAQTSYRYVYMAYLDWAEDIEALESELLKDKNLLKKLRGNNF